MYCIGAQLRVPSCLILSFLRLSARGLLPDGTQPQLTTKTGRYPGLHRTDQPLLPGRLSATGDAKTNQAQTEKPSPADQPWFTSTNPWREPEADTAEREPREKTHRCSF